MIGKNLEATRRDLEEPYTYFCRQCKCCFKSKVNKLVHPCSYCGNPKANRIN